MILQKNSSKKGIFFTIDGILGAGIVFAAIYFASTFYIEEQPTFQVNYMSQDLLEVLASANVVEIKNPYVDSLISSGDITNLDNSVIQQIVEFWVEDDILKANLTAKNVSSPLIPTLNGFGLWIDGEAIYSRDLPLKKSLISSKKIVSGSAKGQQTGETRNNPPTLFGPAIVEVRVWQ
jgi:hypothetical protein